KRDSRLVYRAITQRRVSRMRFFQGRQDVVDGESLQIMKTWKELPEVQAARERIDAEKRAAREKLVAQHAKLTAGKDGGLAKAIKDEQTAKKQRDVTEAAYKTARETYQVKAQERLAAESAADYHIRRIEGELREMMPPALVEFLADLATIVEYLQGRG